MTVGEHYHALLAAFADENISAIEAITRRLIVDELAANNVREASDLKRVLGDLVNKRTYKTQALSPLQGGPRHAEPLLAIKRIERAPYIKLSAENDALLARFLTEHRRREDLQRHGLYPKKSLLFYGPSGCGKTLCAHFIAHELGWPLAIVRLSTLFSSYLGDSSRQIRDIFSSLRNQRYVLLFDEFDAVGKEREDANDVGELKRVVNSLLQELDLARTGESVLIATSNHQKLLDSALWRRFDEVVHFQPPAKSTIAAYLKDRLNGVALAGTWSTAAQALAGLTFASIDAIINECLKTMILDGSDEMSLSVLTEQVRHHKKALKRATGGDAR